MTLHQPFPDILICPQCGGKVRYDGKANGIICDQCQLLYEIKNDIPNLLLQEAVNLRKQ